MHDDVLLAPCILNVKYKQIYSNVPLFKKYQELQLAYQSEYTKYP